MDKLVSAILILFLVVFTYLVSGYLMYKDTHKAVERKCLTKQSIVLNDNTYKCELIKGEVNE